MLLNMHWTSFVKNQRNSQASSFSFCVRTHWFKNRMFVRVCIPGVWGRSLVFARYTAEVDCYVGVVS